MTLTEYDEAQPPIIADRMEVRQDETMNEDIIIVPTDRQEVAKSTPIPLPVQNSAAKE